MIRKNIYPSNCDCARKQIISFSWQYKYSAKKCLEKKNSEEKCGHLLFILLFCNVLNTNRKTEKRMETFSLNAIENKLKRSIWRTILQIVLIFSMKNFDSRYLLRWRFFSDFFSRFFFQIFFCYCWVSSFEERAEKA